MLQMNPIIITCRAKDWFDVLNANLKQGTEVDLTDFNYPFDEKMCKDLARVRGMEFTVDYPNKTAFFRNKKSN